MAWHGGALSTTLLSSPCPPPPLPCPVLRPHLHTVRGAVQIHQRAVHSGRADLHAMRGSMGTEAGPGTHALMVEAACIQDVAPLAMGQVPRPRVCPASSLHKGSTYRVQPDAIVGPVFEGVRAGLDGAKLPGEAASEEIAVDDAWHW